MSTNSTATALSWTTLAGSCSGGQGNFVRIADSSTGGCLAACAAARAHDDLRHGWPATHASGEGCVAYSISLSWWESDYCTLWGPTAFSGGADANPFRECHALTEYTTAGATHAPLPAADGSIDAELRWVPEPVRRLAFP